MFVIALGKATHFCSARGLACGTVSSLSTHRVSEVSCLRCRRTRVFQVARRCARDMRVTKTQVRHRIQ